MRAISLISFLLCNSILLAQSPQWESWILIEHPTGATDTIWVGFDTLADNGFQPTIDVLDSTLGSPISIGIHNQVLEDSLDMTSCVNLKADIRGFTEGTVVFKIFTHKDIPGQIMLRWNSSSFQYRQDGFFMQQVTLENLSGYIGGIDNDEFFITSYDQVTDELFFNSNEAVSSFEGDRCGNGEHDGEFLLKIGFNLYPTSLEEITTAEIKLSPNPAKDVFNLRVPDRGKIRVNSIAGKLILEMNTLANQPTTTINATNWPNGIYILTFTDENGGVLRKKLIKI